MFACTICVATKGLKGSELDSLPKSEDELIDHLERVHHYVVRRHGESDEEAARRCDEAYPERKNCAECTEAG